MLKEIIAINLGCGTHIAPNWINFDNSPNVLLSKIKPLKDLLYKIGILKEDQYKAKFNNEITFRELTKPLPFENNTVDFAYTSHFLEHLSKENCNKVLSEIYRVLKPGGIARLVIPDLSYFIKQYEQNKKENNPEAADIFMVGIWVINGARDPHLWMYDAESFSIRLKNIGFKDITVCGHKKGKCKDVEFLDNRPLDSLHIEVSK